MEPNDRVRDANTTDEEMERDTEIRRETQVRGSLGVPPSGEERGEDREEETDGPNQR